MSVYSINELGRLTNLKAHTIRTWELRYNILKPHRTHSNIRYYDDKQLKKLLNVCELIKHGMKISDISKLTGKQFGEEIDKLMIESFQQEVHFETIINQSLIAVITFDEILFDKIFSNAILRFGMVNTYLQIVYPLMIRTGLMWIKDDILPAHEHFLTYLIKQKLFAAIDPIPLPQHPDQTWILFLNENEEHEIGLLLAGYILRQQGKRVIYLGGAVPYANLSLVAAKCNPTHIYTFFVRNLPSKELMVLLESMSNDFKKTTICVSGRKEIFEKITLGKNVVYIAEMNNLVELTKHKND